MEPLIGASADSVGFKYDFGYQLNHVFGIARMRSKLGDSKPTFLDVKLTSSGEVSSKNQSKDFQNHVKASMVIDYRIHPHFTLDVPQPDGSSERRPYAYPMGLQVKPFEFETNQTGDVANYTASALLVAAVPYSDGPVLWWQAKTGVNRYFVPLVIAAGYSYVSELEDDGPMDDDLKGNSRFDFEALYNIPVAENIDLRASWLAYLGSKSGFENLLDVGLTYYVDEKRNSGFRVSYQRGADAPTYINKESIRLGYDFTFF